MEGSLVMIMEGKHGKMGCMKWGILFIVIQVGRRWG
jgi:hypothetical protein